MTAPIRLDGASHSARRLAPHASLVTAVRCYFAARVHTDLAAHRLLPDGCVDLLFDLSQSSATPTGAVVGVTTSALHVHRPPGTALFGVTFLPGEALRFLDVPLDALRDRIVDLADLLGPDGVSLASALREASTDEARAQRVDAFLRARLSRSRPRHDLTRTAIALLRAHGGRVSMLTLRRELGSSERRLQRAFLEATGVPPKTMARIVRLQGVIDRLTNGRSTTITALAHELGFADQAHLNHEFRDLTGLSPVAFARVARTTAH